MEARFRGRQSDLGFELPSHNYDTNRSRRPLIRAQKDALFPKKFALPIVLVLIISTYIFCKYMDQRLPTPLTSEDASANPKGFIEERARNDLALFTALGPRVCGSHANDIAAVDMLVRTLREIDRAKVPVHSIEIDIQKPTGAFFMSFQEGLTSSYASVPLVIAKLEPASGSVNHSVLINCHFDSVPGSPGASDDMISCVTMLEVLRVLSRQTQALRNTIIFLFNGAEENGMQASHGFVAGRQTSGNNASPAPGGGPGSSSSSSSSSSSNTDSPVGHRWSKNLRTFINLEASGAGGREVLFQTGPGNGWILNSYAQAPYPYGSVVGEEIFQRGLIPSDTDFRIFRDYADIPGLDMAFIKNGWVYHTKFDNLENIPPGSIQHIGSNTLAILDYLSNLDYNEVQYTSEKMVYFDLFGLYMVIYSETTSIIINLIVGLVAVYFAWREAGGDGSTMLVHLVTTLVAWLVGILTAVSVGLLLNLLKYYIPFYSYPALALPLFGIPAIAAQVFVYSVFFNGREDDTWIAGKTTLAFLLLACSFTSRALFTVTINLGFGIVGWVAARKLFKDSQRKLLCYLAIGEVFPLSMAFYLINNFVDVFVPIMGRSGTESNPNLFVAILTAVVLTVPTFTGLIPVFVFFKKSFYKISAALMAVILLVIVIGIGRVPYGEKTPMRLHLVEVDRTWFEADLTTVKKSDSGYWFFNLDPNVKAFLPTFADKNPEINHAVDMEVDSCDTLNCGLPYYFPVVKLIRRTQWLAKPTGLAADLKGRVRMDLIQDSFISPSVRRLSLSFIGTDHLTIVLSPGDNWELIRWSLTSEVPNGNINFKNRPTYFIYHGRGITFERFEITLDLRRKSPINSNTLPVEQAGSSSGSGSGGDASSSNALDIVYSAFWLHGDEMKSEEMKGFMGKFPEWTYGLGWTASSNIYSIP